MKHLTGSRDIRRRILKSEKTTAGRPRRRVFAISLTEVMVTSVLLLMLTVAGLSGLATANRCTAISAQYGSAIALCQDVLEDMRAADFEDVSRTNFPEEESLSLTHTSASTGELLPCTRTISIEDESTSDLDAKRVTIAVTWSTGGRSHDVVLESILHDYY